MNGSNRETTLVVLGVMWLTYVIATIYILSSFGMAIIPIVLFMTFALIAMSRIISGIREDSSMQSDTADDTREKRKRDRLDAVLRDLSDDELHRLRDRLQYGTIDDALLERRIIGDDGELLRAD